MNKYLKSFLYGVTNAFSSENNIFLTNYTEIKQYGELSKKIQKRRSDMILSNRGKVNQYIKNKNK